MCKSLCTGEVPLPQHLLQCLFGLRKSPALPLLPLPFLPFALQVQQLVSPFAGKLVSGSLVPRRIPRISRSIGLVLLAWGSRRSADPPQPHHPRVPPAPAGPELFSPQRLRPVHPPQVFGQRPSIPHPHRGKAAAHPMHHAAWPFSQRVDPLAGGRPTRPSLMNNSTRFRPRCHKPCNTWRSRRASAGSPAGCRGFARPEGVRPHLPPTGVTPRATWTAARSTPSSPSTWRNSPSRWTRASSSGRGLCRNCAAACKTWSAKSSCSASAALRCAGDGHLPHVHR
jgi:hypothetical protein